MENEEAKISGSVKAVPGGYGLPFFGAMRDRLELYWFQGDVEFFKRRIEKYKSTVFRTNFAPGPPGYQNPRGVALLDHKSFQVMLDNSKVDKSDTFFGTAMPSVAFTGGYRALPYLDTTEEKHTLYKRLLIELLHMKFSSMVTEYSKAFAETSATWELAVAKSGKAEVGDSSGSMVVNVLLKSITGHQDPASIIGSDPHSTFQTWSFVQFAGTVVGVLPHFVEELTYHSFSLPSMLVKSKYAALCKFFRNYATEALDLAESKYGLDREEAVHQLVFCFGVNARVGLMKKIPVMVYYIAKMGPEFQARLANEVRSAISEQGGGGFNVKALSGMPLLKSTVLEAFRLMPSTFFVYARAREDIVVESHDALYKVGKGELLGAHWYYVLRDPKVFEDPQRFNPERFMGKQGEALFPQLVWSNGRQDQTPGENDKQCPAKDYAVMLTSQFVAEMFLKYDAFEITDDSTIDTTSLKVAFKSLKKRTQISS
ncbi:hypothetical protein SELMODRAFT_120083 [Selaginella moellendorffii]|uniref:Allene oxide synthase n=2 Tax=Selaginella moellendorffii TaxID=88036 RepID=D8SM53_SELML|nr:hypothetical protein SELMODRAFT_120083 [Selaginella moellendorffii]